MRLLTTAGLAMLEYVITVNTTAQGSQLAQLTQEQYNIVVAALNAANSELNVNKKYKLTLDIAPFASFYIDGEIASFTSTKSTQLHRDNCVLFVNAITATAQQQMHAQGLKLYLQNQNNY
jgi:hypothetical protein